jgi:hypothetical protein
MEPFFTDIGDQIRPYVARLWEQDEERLMSLRVKYGHKSQAILGAPAR